MFKLCECVCIYHIFVSKLDGAGWPEEIGAEGAGLGAAESWYFPVFVHIYKHFNHIIKVSYKYLNNTNQSLNNFLTLWKYDFLLL